MNHDANAGTDQMICGEKYRITVITDALIRFEYSESGCFEDSLTTRICSRDLGKCNYTAEKDDEILNIETACVKIRYNQKKFTGSGLSVKLKGTTCNYGAEWRYGQRIYTLKGTVRTLDGVDGSCELEEGLVARTGITVLDDSDSMLIDQAGNAVPRQVKEQDFYVFGYGHDYMQCIRDFFRLCGHTPLLPRYTLGNWWSRYYKYTQDEYKGLIRRFEKEGIPFAVAVLDMDWHITKPDARYGSGWTGYTWNKELFPDPEEFLTWLHKRGLHVTLNDHPADGIRPFEECYESVCQKMGLDAAKEKTVECELSDPLFVEAYFEKVLHPLEEQGVDFWWIDWQQGNCCEKEGLDPLWMQNYLHIKDMRDRNKNAVILSRYAGIGSHKYPIGFSGDTVISWESLRFQPYFTCTASNVGYCWWSHDIGGHMLGYRDDELAGRWLQFGVFSPICRLHSSDNPFSGKEPWNYSTDVKNMMIHFLRLRHQLVPYLFTMNVRCHQGEPFIKPMYYLNPEDEPAYEMRDQYYFGTDIIVAPVTERTSTWTHKASVTVWLPEGKWYDFFTERCYTGNQKIRMYRGIENLPVLVRAGSIIPMTEEISGNCVNQNPRSLWIRIFGDEEGNFCLYENENGDDSTEDENLACTRFSVKKVLSQQDTSVFCIDAVQGNTAAVPQKRNYKIEFVGCYWGEVMCQKNGIQTDTIEFDEENQILLLQDVSVKDHISVFGKTDHGRSEDTFTQELYELLQHTECEFTCKNEIYQAALTRSKWEFVKELEAMQPPDNLMGCIMELI